MAGTLIFLFAVTSADVRFKYSIKFHTHVVFGVTIHYSFYDA